MIHLSIGIILHLENHLPLKRINSVTGRLCFLTYPNISSIIYSHHRPLQESMCYTMSAHPKKKPPVNNPGFIPQNPVVSSFTFFITIVHGS